MVDRQTGRQVGGSVGLTHRLVSVKNCKSMGCKEYGDELDFKRIEEKNCSI